VVFIGVEYPHQQCLTVYKVVHRVISSVVVFKGDEYPHQQWLKV